MRSGILGKPGILLLIIGAFSFYTCKKSNPGVFNEGANTSISYTLSGDSITFGEILKKHKGKKIVVDVWASWCPDCWRNFPKLAKVQNTVSSENVAFIFLSVDENKDKWKRSLDRVEPSGEHYLQQGDWNSPLNDHLGVREIPTLVLIDENGTIINHDAAKLPPEELIRLLK